MTTPTAFLVDLNQSLTPHVGVAVDGSGVPTMVTVDGSGNPVTTPVGGSGSSPSSATPQAAAGTGSAGTATPYARGDHAHPISGNVPTAVATGHTFANGDNGELVLATSTPNYVLNTGLMPGWGVPVKGAFTLTGSAAVTDLRNTTGTPWCCIEQTAADGSTYDLVGTK